MNTGSLFVAVPAVDDPINELSSEDQAHITMVWFGEAEDLEDELVTDLYAALHESASKMGAFEAKVAGTAQIGPDKASVLIIESKELVELRQYMLEIPAVQTAQAKAEQFPWWIPHTTLGYDTESPTEIPDTIKIDRIGMWIAGDKTHTSLERSGVNLTSALSLPVISCAADVSLGVRYGNTVPAARWYVAKRAQVFGVDIPEQWSRT